MQERQRAKDFLNGTPMPKGTKLIGGSNLSFFLGLDSAISVRVLPETEMLRASGQASGLRRKYRSGVYKKCPDTNLR